MCLLSIITPFYNSENKCRRLLLTLANINDADVEVVLVDDGSTDKTLNIIEDFKNEANVNVKVISQNNKGPGGARNAGFRASSGRYVWFVDSDDDVRLAVIDVVRKYAFIGYDFIDFDIVGSYGITNSIGVGAGEYSDSECIRITLLKRFGRICSKVFRRDLIENNKLFYPEHCVYEDNYLTFLYPFYIAKFLKSDVVGYQHNEDYSSVTRSAVSARYFDRMSTAACGFKAGSILANTEDEMMLLREKFINLYLKNTVSRLLRKRKLSEVVVACRVMGKYRTTAKEVGVIINPLNLVNGSKKYRLVLAMLWLFSCFLPNQSDYFDRLRHDAWGLPFTEEV